MTEKLKQEVNPLSAVVQQVAQICPAAVQNGKIDFERLRTEWSADLNEPDMESYNFTWVGKNAAIAEANKKIRKTLRPVKADSKDWENTQNLYIEGDNLDVLKLLQESYQRKVKMIYIDPPYNTGNDFVYCDDFTLGCEEYIEKKGQCDIETNERLFRNTETNGRFHSDWCSMIYPRLKIARDLLSDDGVIFISIDDHEVANLRKICDEVFGEDNFVAQIVWEQGRKSMAAQVAINHEYCLIYCKNKIVNISKCAPNDWKIKKDGLLLIYEKYEELKQIYGDDLDNISSGMKSFYNSLPESNPSKAHAHYNCVDQYLGLYYPGDIAQGTGQGGKFEILHPITNKPCKVPAGGWRFSQDKLPDLLKNHRIHFGRDETTIPCIKRYLKETEYEVFSSVFYKDGRGASKRLDTLIGKGCFEHPKDEEILKNFVTLVSSNPREDSIILDFFSGSASMAHAVMQLNAEDGGNRKFIMVQLPEATDEKSEAYKAGYKNICEIGKERIRRAGDKIMSEHPDAKIDTGFRVFRLDDTNMKDVYYKPVDTAQNSLLDMVDNIKPDRTDMDLLFGAMLERGLMLDMPVEEVQSNGITYYVVNNGNLIACFAENIPESVIHEIANRRPFLALFRDSSFAESKDKINLTEIFKNVDTNIKVCVL